MPTKKTTTKKTAKVTANFTANIPEDAIGCCQNKRKTYKKWWSEGALYFLWMVGAAIYYISIATSFRVGALGVLKAFVRPVFLVHGLLKFLAL